MSSPIRFLTVDDEYLARQRMRDLIDEYSREHRDDEIVCAGEAENGVEALSLLNMNDIDVVFLDIEMPGMNGFEVVEQIKRPRPHIVFVTAYDEYALKAFEVHALDYLTKPVKRDRLSVTLERLQSSQHLKFQHAAIDKLNEERAQAPLTRLTVHSASSLCVLSVNSILRIEAEDKIVKVFTSSDSYRTDLRLDVLEARLDQEQFMRIHRSHVVRIDAIREIIPWFSGSYCVKLSDGTQLPVARRRVAQMKAKLGRVV